MHSYITRFLFSLLLCYFNLIKRLYTLPTMIAGKESFQRYHFLHAPLSRENTWSVSIIKQKNLYKYHEIAIRALITWLLTSYQKLSSPSSQKRSCFYPLLFIIDVMLKNFLSTWGSNRVDSSRIEYVIRCFYRM